MAGSSPRTRLSEATWLLRKGAVARYGFPVFAVAVALALWFAVVSVTGTVPPFAPLVTATLVAGLFAGAGPALLTVVLSLPALTLFLVRTGTLPHRVALQLVLYAANM